MPYTATFRGIWLVEPDPDDTRAADDGYDAGAYWGVALVEGGDFLVYIAHCNELRAPQYDVVGDLDQADLPTNIYVEAALEFNALLQNEDDKALAVRAEPYEVRMKLDLR